MTPEQERWFVQIMAAPYTVGAIDYEPSWHPWDALRLYAEIFPELSERALSVMVDFHRHCTYCPEQAAAIEPVEVYQRIAEYWVEHKALEFTPVPPEEGLYWIPLDNAGLFVDILAFPYATGAIACGEPWHPWSALRCYLKAHSDDKTSALAIDVMLRFYAEILSARTGQFFSEEEIYRQYQEYCAANPAIDCKQMPEPTDFTVYLELDNKELRLAQIGDDREGYSLPFDYIPTPGLGIPMPFGAKVEWLNCDCFAIGDQKLPQFGDRAFLIDRVEIESHPRRALVVATPLP